MFQGRPTDAGVSSFQALTMTLAGRGNREYCGHGNYLRWSGRAFLDVDSGFFRCQLRICGIYGTRFIKKNNGEYRGGPAFYIEKGLGVKWYAWLFAIVTIFSCGYYFRGAGKLDWREPGYCFWSDPNVTAALLAVLLSFIIFGGVKRIASFSSMVVPFMALYYCRLRDYRD
jgi:AGCS family alanine or glycine:cation symporter